MCTVSWMERANQRPLIIWLLQWLVCSGTIAQDSETCVYKQTLTPYSGEWFRFWQVGASPNCWILEVTLLHRCFVLIGKWLAKPCNSPQQWPGGARLQDVRSSVKSSEGPWWWGANWGHPGESYLQIVLTIAAFTTISSIIMCIYIYMVMYMYMVIYIYKHKNHKNIYIHIHSTHLSTYLPQKKTS